MLYSAAALLFALGDSISKVLLISGLDATRLSQLRLTGACAAIACVLLVVNRQAFRIARRDIPVLLAYGIVGVALTQTFTYLAYARLSIGVALLVVFSAPVLVALWFVVVRREPSSKLLWGSLSLVFAGLALVAQPWSGLNLDGLGALSAVLAAFCYASYYILGDREVRGANRRHPASMVLWGFVGGALFWAIVLPWWSFPFEKFATSVALGGGGPEVSFALLAIVLILGCTVAAFYLAVASLRHIQGSQASTVALVGLPFSAAIAWALLGESLSPMQVTGMAVVLVGVALAERVRGRQGSQRIVG